MRLLKKDEMKRRQRGEITGGWLRMRCHGDTRCVQGRPQACVLVGVLPSQDTPVEKPASGPRLRRHLPALPRVWEVCPSLRPLALLPSPSPEWGARGARWRASLSLACFPNPPFRPPLFSSPPRWGLHWALPASPAPLRGPTPHPVSSCRTTSSPRGCCPPKSTRLGQLGALGEFDRMVPPSIPSSWG